MVSVSVSVLPGKFAAERCVYRLQRIVRIVVPVVLRVALRKYVRKGCAELIVDPVLRCAPLVLATPPLQMQVVLQRAQTLSLTT
jgi:hypothetical protein